MLGRPFTFGDEIVDVDGDDDEDPVCIRLFNVLEADEIVVVVVLAVNIELSLFDDR